MYPKTHIVIIGGGFAGVACARACAARFRGRPEVMITLITPHPYHEFTPAWYVGATEIEAMACADHGEAGHAVEKALCMPLAYIFSARTVQVVYGWVQHIDRRARTVTVPPRAPMHYSYLILALGSETDYFDIPGVREYAYTLKTVKDVLRLRHALEKVLQKKESRIIIGGGGFTGAELAAELALLIQKKRLRAEVQLIEGMTPVLSQLKERVSKAARSRLAQLGVRLSGGVRISSVRRAGGGVEVHLSNQQSQEGDLLVWAGGVRGAQLYQQMFPLYVGAQGRVTVEPTLQVVGEQRVFAIGDGTYLATHEYAQGLPMQAWTAIAEGKHAAENIARLHAGKSPLPFVCSTLPYVIPLGGRYGIVAYHRRVWRGFFPWAFKQLIELWYYTEVLGWRSGFRLWTREEKMCLSE